MAVELETNNFRSFAHRSALSMPQPYLIYVIIPAFDEERSIGHVLEDLPRDFLEEVIVVDNNSKVSSVESSSTWTWYRSLG